MFLKRRHDGEKLTQDVVLYVIGKTIARVAVFSFSSQAKPR